MIVRAALPSDAADFERMSAELDAYLEALDPHDQSGPAVTQSAEAFLRNGFGDDPCHACLIAEQEGRALGYLLYFFGYWSSHAARALFVADLFVREEARGQGAGRALMHGAARALRARGGSTILWTVWDKNPAAIRFYQSLGARLVREELLMAWQEADWP